MRVRVRVSDEGRRGGWKGGEAAGLERKRGERRGCDKNKRDREEREIKVRDERE